jgi:hypothetical protein
MKIIKEVGRNPHIDWIAIVFLSTTIVAVLAIGGIYLYNAVNRGEIQSDGAEPASTAKNLDKKALSAVIQKFSEKEEVTRRMQSGYAGPSDPSI